MDASLHVTRSLTETVNLRDAQGEASSQTSASNLAIGVYSQKNVFGVAPLEVVKVGLKRWGTLVPFLLSFPYTLLSSLSPFFSLFYSISFPSFLYPLPFLQI